MVAGIITGEQQSYCNEVGEELESGIDMMLVGALAKLKTRHIEPEDGIKDMAFWVLSCLSERMTRDEISQILFTRISS